ncbi:hypothetical protein BE04_49705 [Sorangium cellulosum]|uniref:Secreted protein n=2 Tax=Sorangium cellulosum TaxID=56 RepID=A0A150P9J4_SORCE|nr:hypothetical protein [Sorangium cellulosum]AGP40958.1 hypothetical protein SCE1572_44580 [Sorangium cellulosum So0157-2]KYF52261.1 hypothetical protein BE04_49705 [Sorangium cellulosum]
MKTIQRLAPLLAGASALSMGGGSHALAGTTSDTIEVAARSDAASACAHPRPLFGKVVAVCGDQMIAYVGDETVEILGVKTTSSRFELAYCSNGGGRKPLSLETNSEGFTLASTTYANGEHYTISHMWGTFRMSGIGFSGEKVDVQCVPFEDRRTDVRYLH